LYNIWAGFVVGEGEGNKKQQQPEKETNAKKRNYLVR
jgi:hypothetical protein